MNSIRFIILFLFLPLLSYSQEQNPPSIHWKTIKTEHFNVVFPEEITSKGIYAANMLEYLYAPVSQSLYVRPQRISLFINNQSVYTNGYVSLAPQKIVWYSTPYQNINYLGGGDWFYGLATHELRHVAQNEFDDRNFNRFLHVLAGDLGLAAGAFLSQPRWITEGDAVFAETALSLSGRGRLPAFDMEAKAALSSGKRYSYDMAYLGSYKYYCPSFYTLGYHLSAYLRNEYGNEKWNILMERTTRMTNPFSSNCKKTYGIPLRKLFSNSYNFLEKKWNEEDSKLLFTVCNTVNNSPKNIFTNYTYPCPVDSEKIIALKNGFSQRDMLVLLDEHGNEKKLREISADDAISYSSDKVVWNTLFSDIRWGERSYSDIMLYDINTGKKKRLTHRKKYFAPSLSPDGKKIATVEFPESLECSIVILDISGKQMLHKVSLPSDEFIRTPSWSADGEKIVFSKTKGSYQYLCILDLSNDSITDILKTSEVISRPLLYNDYILFNASASGRPEIHAVNNYSKKRYIVVSRKYGAFNPMVATGKEQLFFQDYSPNGYNIAVMPSDTTLWKEITYNYSGSTDFSDAINELSAGFNVCADSVQMNEYEVTGYKKLINSINIHSWLPEPDFPGYTSTKLQIYSTNNLNTLNLTAEAGFNTVERTFSEKLQIEYAGLFPLLYFSAQNGDRTLFYNFNDNNDKYSWNEKGAGAGFTLPFNISGEVYNSEISAGAYFEYMKITEISGALSKYAMDTKDQIMGLQSPGIAFCLPVTKSELFPVSFIFSFQRNKKRALRDIYPRWGQNIHFMIRNTSDNILGISDNSKYLHPKQTSAVSAFYFPGIARHHSSLLKLCYETNYTEFNYFATYYFPVQISPVKGYKNTSIYPGKNHYLLVSANYSLPICYPDLSIGSLIYIKRIWMNNFIEYGGRLNTANTYTGSAGSEFTFNFNILRLPADLNMTLRFSYLMNEEKIQTQFIVLDIPIL